MRLFTVLGLLFYTIIVCAIGTLMLAFSVRLLPFNQTVSALNNFYTDANLRLIIGLSGILLILIAYSFTQIILGRMQKERTIAFSNPSGRVTIALSAVEDLIKHIYIAASEIKELRPYVIATKKGIEVDLRLVLRTEANIPELTARLQEAVKSKLQEVLGIDEPILVKIHVAKIISREEKDKKPKKEQEVNIPFSNF